MHFIPTSIGRIAVYKKGSITSLPPIIFLHGVYFDHHLWDEIIAGLEGRTLITIDMPLHGKSKELRKQQWNLQDCATMLLEILDYWDIPKVIAVGHSWGSMTILRAATRQQERFTSVVLCNMPFRAPTFKQKLIFPLQHVLLTFRDFYTLQTAKTLFGKQSLQENALLTNHLMRTMSALSNKEIKQIDRTIILDAEDTDDLIANLRVEAIVLKGEEDYLQVPKNIESKVIKGGHISPLEHPSIVLNTIKSRISP
jgi:pimeloyl-ACP methyl ester carboxylesterase